MEIIGNSKIIEFLEKAAENQALAHGYIFNGPESIGKTKTAQWISAKILGVAEEKLAVHPDFRCADVNIGKEEMDDITRWLSLSAFSGPRKILVIAKAHEMSLSAANAFLKILEEPPEKTLVLLLTSELGKILPTIISRSVVLNFKPATKDEIIKFLNSNYKLSDTRQVASFALGLPGRAAALAEDKDFLKNINKDVEEFVALFFGPQDGRFKAAQMLLDKKNETREIIVKKIDFWLQIIRDICMYKYNLNDEVRYINKLERFQKMAQSTDINHFTGLAAKFIKMRSLVDNNINIKLMLENLII